MNVKMIVFCILTLMTCLLFSADKPGNFTKFNDKQPGSLTVITGPMYSGKTARLIDYIRLAHQMGKIVEVYSHGLDSKKKDSLFSRAYPQDRIEAFKTCDSSDIIREYFRGSFNCIAIDEAQFFTPDLAHYVELMLDCRAIVYVAGLDTNYRGEQFSETMSKLYRMADLVVNLVATCAVCGKDATMTQRLVNGLPAVASDDLIVVEGSIDVVKYEPRCRNCHILK